MTSVLAVSPHLDDAVFSAGGMLSAMARAGATVVVLTCFTGSVRDPRGFALACQLDKGLPADVDYMALRRAEDEAACAAIGAHPVHLPHYEAPHRGYDSAAQLFGAIRGDDGIAPALAADIAAAVGRYRPALVLGPIGIGGHVDHLLVRDALGVAAPPDRTVRWADYPYALRRPDSVSGLHRRPLQGAEAAARTRAALAYTSQIGFQFGGVEQARAAFAAHPCEYFDAPFPAAEPSDED